MSKISIRWGWFLGIAICGSSICSTNCAFAQIILDGTLPNNSSVKLEGNNSIIEGGTQAGGNLFHSFREFSVPINGAALFNNAADIQNIISRVTGGSVSNIDGIIGASGTANLFLINPNGIVFGQNAQLNVGGSFVASTANALQFGNIGFFSATEKNIPSPLLTINPSALLFNQINQNAAIQNNSIALAGNDPAGLNALGLRVPDGKSLLLVGGNVSMDGGRLNANGGRVELGGLGEPGTVALGVDGDNLSLIFPENIARTSVSLTNQAGIYVTGAGGGNIAVNARNLEILRGSVLTAGIGQGLGTSETIGGDITLNATGEIKVTDGSIVRNLVRLGSQGNGGNITIDSGSFSLRDGAFLSASTLGQGNAGNVTVRAVDAVSLAQDTYILSTVEAGGVGKGGNIDINAATLSLIDGAQLLTATRNAFDNIQAAGQGDVGNVTVNVTGIVNIAGEKNGFLSGISSRLGTATVGNGGNITIDSGSFSLGDGAQISASTFGQGNAGNVTVRARDAVSLADAYILSTVSAGGVGKGGNIDINAATLSLIDGAQLQTTTRGASATAPAGRGDAGNVNVNVTGIVNIAGEKNGFLSGISSRLGTATVGNGGNITINSGSFSLGDGAQISASTFGQGNAGNVTVRARDAVSLADAYILSTVSAGGVGKGGNIDINAATLSLIDGAQLQTTTRGASATAPAGQGDAGNVNVNVTGIVNIAGGKNGFRSGISSRVETGTVGNGGNITIDSGSFSLRDGAQLQASTGGIGDGGSLKVNASDFVELIGRSNGLFTNGLTSGLTSAVQQGAMGNGGEIIFFTNRFVVRDGGEVTVSNLGTGNAGRIQASVFDVFLNNQGRLTAESVSGKGGDIQLQVGNLLLLRRNSLISASSGAAGSAGLDGNINIDTKFLVAVPSENSDIVATGFGRTPGSNIQVNAQGIFGTQFRQQQSSESDIVATGNVTLNIPDIDPNRGLVRLPSIPIDTKVVQSCNAGGNLAKSSFTITGRGGLPPNPGEALNTDAVQVDLVSLNPNSDNRDRSFVPSKITTPAPEPIIEATALALNEKGEVVMTANLPTTTPHSPWLKPASCTS